MTKEHCVLPSLWCLRKPDMAEKGCRMINGNLRVIWPQHTNKTSVSIRGRVDPEFLYGVETEEDEAHISGYIISSHYCLMV